LERELPRTKVVFYREEDGSVPFLKWFEGLGANAQARCLVRIERLQEAGHDLRRPEAAFLRDGIYELRTQHHNVNYRMLYFFHEQEAVLSHGVKKQQARVPPREIDRAIERKNRFATDPGRYTFEETE
jgi:phage-related protein